MEIKQLVSKLEGNTATNGSCGRVKETKNERSKGKGDDWKDVRLTLVTESNNKSKYVRKGDFDSR